MSLWLSVAFLQAQSDARLLALTRAGHERAFEALVRRYRKPLLAHCHRMGMATTKAEDAVQQGLLQAWIALQDGADVRNARPWLHRIVHNVALRTRDPLGDAQLNESLVGADGPEFEIDRRSRVRETLAGLAALPPLQREALISTAVMGHTHEDVAAVLGLSEGAVRGLVYRARTTLRNAVSALTPLPLVEWSAGAGRMGNEVSQGLAGLGGGGGAAGAAAVFKGAAAVTAGALMFGTAVLHPPRHVHELRADAPVSRHRAVASLPAPAESAVIGAGAVATGPARTLASPYRSGDASGGSGRRSTPSSVRRGQSGATRSSGRQRQSGPTSSFGGHRATTTGSSSGGHGATTPSAGGGDNGDAPAPSSLSGKGSASSSSSAGDSGGSTAGSLPGSPATSPSPESSITATDNPPAGPTPLSPGGSSSGD